VKRMLVIGIGSLVMRDDGIGARAVEAIGSRLREHDVASFVGETDFQSCFDEIRPDDFVIIVDAMLRGAEPGRIDVTPLDEALKDRSRLRAQHEFSLFDLMELHAPETQGCFIGIEAAEIGFGFELSEPLNSRFEQICSDLSNTILKIKENGVSGKYGSR